MILFNLYFYLQNSIFTTEYKIVIIAIVNRKCKEGEYMLLYDSTHGFTTPVKAEERERLFQCSDLLSLITTNHYHRASGCFTALECMSVFLGNGCFQIGVLWALGAQVFREPDPAVLHGVLEQVREVIHAPIWYAYTCGGRLYFLLCYPRLRPGEPDCEQIAKTNVADFEMLQSQVKEDGLRVLASDLCRGEAEIYLMTNSLRHAIEYAEFRGGAFDSVYIRMEEQLHKAFVEDLSSYRILATQITDAIRLPDCDSAVLAQEIGGHIIANSSASMESVHHHLQIFVLSFTDYLGSSGTVNASFLSHRRITTKIMRFEREEEMIQRLREILDEIRQQFQRLETAGRQNQILLIRDYVDAHITDPALTVGYVAEQFRAAPSHLTAQFQRYFGVTLYKYIQRERLNHCRALLKSAPSMTVEELAAASGYTDLSTMYRAFKRYEGTTPGALRITCLRGKQ